MKTTLKHSFRVTDSHIIFSRCAITVSEVDSGDRIEICGFDDESLRLAIYNYIVDQGLRAGDEADTEWLEDILFRAASSLEKINPSSGVVKAMNKINTQEDK